MKKLTMIALATLFSAFCAGPGSSTPAAADEGTTVGAVAMDFTLVDQNGNPVSLSDHKGKVILLNISTMWCPPCKGEAMEAESIYQAYKDKGFVIINVLIQNARRQPVKHEDTITWSAEYGLTFPVLADERLDVWNAYDEENSIPLNLVIDRDLVIRFKRVGFDRQGIEAQVRKLLEGEGS